MVQGSYIMETVNFKSQRQTKKDVFIPTNSPVAHKDEAAVDCGVVAATVLDPKKELDVPVVVVVGFAN